MTIQKKMAARKTIAPKGRQQTLEYAWCPADGNSADGNPADSNPADGNSAADSDSPPDRSVTEGLLFLHEGLGSVALWRRFPAELCARTGRRALVYSRFGYGASTPRPRDEPLPADYLEREAQEVLPALLDAFAMERPWLIGHSDGGSIALLAAAHDPERYCGIVTIAPHYRVEPVCLAGIARARAAYEAGHLREKLARHHTDVDAAFYGWCNAWLDPARRGWDITADLKRITLPILAIQGRQDEYATLDQIEAIARHAPQTELLVIEDCGHFPHLTHAEQVTSAIAAFIKAQKGRSPLRTKA
jgi:pimeloyl-ACP methyl ester carboxylesterase